MQTINTAGSQGRPSLFPTCPELNVSAGVKCAQTYCMNPVVETLTEN